MYDPLLAIAGGAVVLYALLVTFALAGGHTFLQRCFKRTRQITPENNIVELDTEVLPVCKANIMRFDEVSLADFRNRWANISGDKELDEAGAWTIYNSLLANKEILEREHEPKESA